MKPSLPEKVKFKLRQGLNFFALPKNRGYCTICESETVFIEYGKWLRDYYCCKKCGSIPRNRALINALNRFYPDWKNLSMHESSPGGILSDYLKNHSKNYSSSHYYEDVKRGEYRGDFRSEDLSAMTFNDNTFDLFITSDVFEHIMEPGKAFSEIARVLKPGGAHVFTMPWYPNLTKTVQRAKVADHKITHLLEPVYHGNPIDETGSLVTFDWGSDFPEFIFNSSRLYTTVYLEKNRRLGLDAEYLEVFVSVKSID
jgi:SAM-dependent methyltransferase